MAHHWLIIAAHQCDRSVAPFRGKKPQDLNPVAFGHGQIEDDNGWLKGAVDVVHLVRVGYRPDLETQRAGSILEELANLGIIIDRQKTRFFGHSPARKAFASEGTATAGCIQNNRLWSESNYEVCESVWNHCKTSKLIWLTSSLRTC